MNNWLKWASWNLLKSDVFGYCYLNLIIMLKRFLYRVLLIILLTFSHLAFARVSQETKSRDVLVKESIANLDSIDIHVAAQAALDLGYYRATEAVPVMLRMLQSPRFLAISEHIMPKDKNGMSFWMSTSVKNAIVTSLGQIGDNRAVPGLKKFLKKPLKNGEVFTGNAAFALYQITGKAYEYKDFDGVQKLFVPGPMMEEEFRKLSRPDLKPTEGLTASLEIEGHEPTGVFLAGDRPLVINLAITNQSKKVIELDAATNNFQLSSVSGDGVRTTTLASLLPSTKPDTEIAVLKPGQKLTLRWTVEKLKDSPLSRGWIGYVSIKCVYINPGKNKRGAMWRGERLISNSVQRYYYPPA